MLPHFTSHLCTHLIENPLSSTLCKLIFFFRESGTDKKYSIIHTIKSFNKRWFLHRNNVSQYDSKCSLKCHEKEKPIYSYFQLSAVQLLQEYLSSMLSYIQNWNYLSFLCFSHKHTLNLCLFEIPILISDIINIIYIHKEPGSIASKMTRGLTKCQGGG